MAKANNGATEDKFESIESALSRTEQYIEENQKSLTIIVGAIVGVILIYFLFNRFYLKPMEAEAQSQMFTAEKYFDKDSFNLALNGDASLNLGFLGVIEEYGLSKVANLAHYYAGICYKNLGKYQESIDYLKKFDSDDQMISNIAQGSIGDCYAELGDKDNAIKYYEIAAENVENDFTSPVYYMRAGLLLEEKGDFKKALGIYEKIQKNFSKSYEAQQIEKYITRVKVKGNIN
jgi:tetratricopeptide (TPR) repeat protein